MRCPRCNYEGELIEGGCARCGFGSVRAAQTHLAFSNQRPSSPRPVSVYRSSRGDVLHQERYRLTEQLTLPENQYNQGTAWFALDTASHRRVIIREIPPLPGFQNAYAEKIRLGAMRLTELSKQQPAIPAVFDLFKDRGNYYLVLEDREGNTLAKLLQHQEGVLPERILAEYGRQLCEVLAALSSYDPSFVHGSISPHTILVSPDGANVSLIHFPLFQPHELPTSKLNGHPGYLAPEQVHGTFDSSSDIYLTGSKPLPCCHRLRPHRPRGFFQSPCPSPQSRRDKGHGKYPRQGTAPHSGTAIPSSNGDAAGSGSTDCILP